MITCGLCVLLTLQAASAQPASTPPKADAATIALARTLTAEFQRERYFPEATLARPESLNALGHLALTSKDEPLVLAAYDTIGRQLSSIASEGKDPRSVHPLVIGAIMAGLRRSERPILDKALGAASALNLGQEGHTPSLLALADMALKHRDPDVMNMAMFNSIGSMSPAFTARHGQIAGSLARLRREGSPGIRAAAIGATAKMFYPRMELPGEPPSTPGLEARAFASELLQSLDDPSPIVRGAAAAAVGFVRFVEGGTPKLVAMLDDKASVAGTISGLHSLSSNDPIELPVRVVDLGEPETVAMAALRALMFRSLYQDPKTRLVCDDHAQSFAECATRARSWGRRARK